MTFSKSYHEVRGVKELVLKDKSPLVNSTLTKLSSKLVPLRQLANKRTVYKIDLKYGRQIQYGIKEKEEIMANEEVKRNVNFLKTRIQKMQDSRGFTRMFESTSMVMG